MNSPFPRMPNFFLLAQQPENAALIYSLWIGLGILFLMAAILVGTRWGHVKPIWKCVALSIFAHILLGGYAYGTRLFFSYSSEREEAPVSFSVIEESPLPVEKEETNEKNSDQPESPWEKFSSENESSPESVLQTRLQQRQVSVPRREKELHETEFQQHEIDRIQPANTSPRESPAPKESGEFVIRKPDRSTVEPTPAEPVPPPVRRDTPFESPNTVDSLVREQQRTPKEIPLPEPENRIRQPVEIQQVKNGLQDRLAQQNASFVPGPGELPDSNSVPENREQPSPHRNISQAKSVVPQAPVVKRRLADGQPIPLIYRNRFADNRALITEQNGGSIQTQQAVENALEWLSGEQEEDGRWDPRRFNAGNEANVYGHNRGGAGFHADTGITGLVVLSFLGAGHTHLEGPYRKNVQKGLEYLIRTQNGDGSMYGNAGLFARTYCHGMALMAIAEAYSITGDGRIRPFVVKGQQYTVSTQNPATGGWRYRPGDDGDMSQFGWQVLALKNCEQAGIPIPTATRSLMEDFLDGYKKGNSGGLAAYRPAEKPTRTMTAEALFCRRLLDLPVSSAMSSEATAFVLEQLPGTAEIDNLYYLSLIHI